MKSRKSAPVQIKKSEDKFHVGTISNIVVTRYKIPRYDGFVVRGGPHGDTRYNRRKEKNRFKMYLKEEGY